MGLLGPVVCVKFWALIVGLVLLGLTVASRPGFTFRLQLEFGWYSWSVTSDRFFQMSIIASAVAIITTASSLLGTTRHSNLAILDAGANLIVGVWLIMYTAHALETFLNGYNDFVKIRCEPLKPGDSTFQTMTVSGDELEICVAEHGSEPTYDLCVCYLREFTKHTITLAAYGFGFITSLSHLGVGILALKSVKSET